jgi:putative tryptophan/tyrosine transport system substrate-binding protein
MRRREFIGGIGVAALPRVARGQQLKMPVIGVLAPFALSDYWRPRMAALHRGLAEIGYVEGRNLAVEYRWAEGHNDRLPGLAADLVRRQVTLILSLNNTPTAAAAKGATSGIPIVFVVGVDPVEYGLVSSLARPGANLTGFTTLTKEVMAKKMELLRELAANAVSVAYLYNPTNFGNEVDDVKKAALSLGLRLLMMDARSQNEIEAAFERMARQRADVLTVSSDTIFTSYSDLVVALAQRHGIPSIFASREPVELGGLISYGVNQPDLYRRAGAYAGRILNGEKPADLPVERPTRLELVINLKTAKALGLTVPETLLATADEVIQ